jgi:hypothetical protein
MVRAALLSLGVTLFLALGVRAQSEGIPITDQDLSNQHPPDDGYPPVLIGPPGDSFSSPAPECGDPLGEPGASSCPQTSVRIGIGFNPTTSQIHGDGVSFWTDESVGASRIEIGHENPNGLGWRVQFWDFDERVRSEPTHVPILNNSHVPVLNHLLFFPPDIEVEASTLYIDVDKTFYTGGAEFKIGGGLAGARLAIDRFREDQFIGIGGSVFGEAYYPFLRFTKADLGVTGHARLAILGSVEKDIIHDSVALIDDFGWGLEYRRRFGARQDKFWYVNVERQYQSWEGGSHINAADEVFQGTSFKVGFAW